MNDYDKTKFEKANSNKLKTHICFSKDKESSDFAKKILKKRKDDLEISWKKFKKMNNYE